MANLNRTFQTNLQKASLSERPSTAPVLEQESLSQLLPPKRDLPFARPRQRQQRYIVPKPNTESTVTNHTGIPEARPQTHTGETSLSQAFQSPATRPTLGVATTPASNNTAVGSPGLNFHSANLTESASVTSSNVSPMKRPLESAPGFSPVKMSKPLSAHSYSSNHHGRETALFPRCTFYCRTILR